MGGMGDINGLQILLREIKTDGSTEIAGVGKCGEYTLYSSTMLVIYSNPIRVSVSAPPNISVHASLIMAHAQLPVAC